MLSRKKLRTFIELVSCPGGGQRSAGVLSGIGTSRFEPNYRRNLLQGSWQVIQTEVKSIPPSFRLQLLSAAFIIVPYSGGSTFYLTKCWE